jgi:Uma2 family endonuclease
MGGSAKKEASYADVLNAPSNKVAEIIHGELVLSPRPAGPHTVAMTALTEELGPPFKRARGGPGGWIILTEPELHLDRDILVPDLAGWRRETMSTVTNEPYFSIRPDWVCEVLSPSTELYDRAAKVALYGAAGVSHAWLVNPLLHTLEILALSSTAPGQWSAIGVHHGGAKVRAQPFQEFELDLSILWRDVQL